MIHIFVIFIQKKILKNRAIIDIGEGRQKKGQSYITLLSCTTLNNVVTISTNLPLKYNNTIYINLGVVSIHLRYMQYQIQSIVKFFK